MQNVEYSSYRSKDPEAADYGRDPFWQAEMIEEALWIATSSKKDDLRGKSFTVTVSEDGLSVTITEFEV